MHSAAGYMTAKMDSPATSTRESCDYTLKWNTEQTTRLIELRRGNAHLFTGARYSANAAWTKILEKMGLQDRVTPLQAKRKWENLQRKYKDCKYPGTGEGVTGKAETWPWYSLMDEVLGQRPSTHPPVLIASIPEEIPGPSFAAPEQPVEEEDGVVQRRSGQGRRKRKREDAIVRLYREDLRGRRERERREPAERKERFDRLLSILEKLADK